MGCHGIISWLIPFIPFDIHPLLSDVGDPNGAELPAFSGTRQSQALPDEMTSGNAAGQNMYVYVYIHKYMINYVYLGVGQNQFKTYNVPQDYVEHPASSSYFDANSGVTKVLIC